jgi:hypothetical protein
MSTRISPGPTFLGKPLEFNLDEPDKIDGCELPNEGLLLIFHANEVWADKGGEQGLYQDFLY